MTTPRFVRRSVRAARRSFAAFCALTFLQSTARAQFLVNSTAETTLPGAITYANALTNPTIAWTSGSPANQSIALSGSQLVNGGTLFDATSAGAAVAINGGNLYLNGSVTFNMTNSMGISTALGDGSAFTGSVAGTLIKGGSGTLTLNVVNTYTGGTIVNGGTLSITSDSNLGNTTDEAGVTLSGGGALQTAGAITTSRTITLNSGGGGAIDAYGNNSLFEGQITGTGQLAVTDSSAGGGGVVSLTNANNNYSGGTLLQQGGTLSINDDAELGTGGLTFTGGALQFQGSLSDSRSIYLESGSGIFETAGATTTLSGVISGVGTLVKASSGTLVLSGANTYTGGTAIKGGVLQVGSESNLGTGGLFLDGGTLLTSSAVTDQRNITIGAVGATINTDGNNDSFYGVISDTYTHAGGGLTKTGAGILTLYGANTYTGGTTVSQGTLQIGANNVMPTGGALNILSGGTFDMNGFSLAPTGALPAYALGNVINNGLLNVGSGQLALGSAATYSGSGTLALALTPGVISVTGGNMTLTGGALQITTVNDPGIKNLEQFTVISATSLNSTQFAGNPISPAAITFTAAYSSTDVVVTAHLIAFASLASTPNQAAVGGALESVRTLAQSNPTSAAGALMSELYTLDTAQIQTAFDQIGPIAYAGMSAIGFSGSSVEAEALGRRMTALDTGVKTGGVTVNTGSGPTVDLSRLFAEGGTDDQDPFGRHFEPEKTSLDSGFGFYGSLVGTTGHQQSMNGSAGFEPGFGFRSGGVIAGGDYRINDAVAVGLAGGYLYSHANVYTDAGSTLDDTAGRAGVYAAIHEGAFRADLYAGGALDYYSTNRGIQVGEASQNAAAKPTGDELNANGYFTYDVPTQIFGVLAPFLGINEDRLMVHTFTESGAGGYDLNVGAQNAQSLRSSLGIRQSTKSSAEGTGTFDAHWSLGWVHEYSNQSRPIDAQLAAGGSSFSVQTASLPADGALVGAGFVINMDKDTSFNLDYSADIRDRFAENSIQAALHLLF